MGRDKQMLEDVYSISSRVSNDEIIDIPKNLAQNWPLHAYFARYSDISLDDVPTQAHQFYLTKKGAASPKKENYKKTDLELESFTLYELIHP